MRAGAGCLAALLCLPLRGQADAAQEQAIASLKQATLELMRTRARQQEGAGTLGIYVGNHDAGMLLDEVRISIDGAPAQRYEYSDREAQALHQDGLHRFALLQLNAGPHHMRADFAARHVDAPPDHWRSAGRLDQDFSVDSQPGYLELELVEGGYLVKPDLRFHELKPAGEGPAATDAFAPGSFADPRLRYAAFLTATEHPLAAAGELYAVQAQAGASADWQARLAQTREALGLVASAADAAETPLALSYDSYNKGVALLREGHLAEGAALLEPIASGKAADAESAALRDQANLVLGYAQLRNHTGANAVPLFSRVRSPGPCSNAAMLGLGWALLAPSGNGLDAVGQADAVKPTDAQAPFRRIPVMLQPQQTPDIATLKRREPYVLKPATPQEEQSLRRALVPWTELIGRDPLDPAVQEGMIAIPYAMNHIGSYEEAQQYFRRAIAVLEAADAQIDQALQRVSSGRMIHSFDTREAADRGWPWWLAAYPKEHWWLADDPRQPLAAPETFYLQHLMADDAFRTALEDFHDLGLIGDTLQHLDGGAALRPRLDAATAAQAALLQDLALNELRSEKRHTRMYLGEARFALAHANEPPPPGGKP